LRELAQPRDSRRPVGLPRLARERARELHRLGVEFAPELGIHRDKWDRYGTARGTHDEVDAA
jgi:hypothetical protein